MTRRFFLVAVDPMPCGVETWPEDVAQVIYDQFRDLPSMPVVFSVDKVTAAVAAVWAGVPVADVCGEPASNQPVPGVNRAP